MLLYGPFVDDHFQMAATMKTQHPLVLASTFIVSLAAATANCQYKYEDVRDFADQAIANGSVRVSEPRFEISCDYKTGQKTLSYYFGNAEIVDPNSTEFDDPFRAVLHEQLRVALIRHFRDTPAKKERWQPTLKAVESQIAQMLADIQDKNLSEQLRQERLTGHRAEIDRHFEEAVKQAAREAKAIAVQQPERGYMVSPYHGNWHSAPIGGSANSSGHHGYGHGHSHHNHYDYSPKYDLGYSFVILSSRPDGRIFYIPAGIWDLYQLAKSRGRRVKQPAWAEVAQGQTIKMGGKYWFKASWDDGTSFRTNGPVVIRSNATVEFSPTGFKVIRND